MEEVSEIPIRELMEIRRSTPNMFMFAVDMLQCGGRMLGNLSNLGARAGVPPSNKDSPCNLMLL